MGEKEPWKEGESESESERRERREKEGEKKEGGEEERQEETLLSFLSRLSFGSHTALLPPHLLEVVTGGNY